MRTNPSPTEPQTADASTEAALRARVETRAYHLWLEAGGRHGDDLKHWLQAERDILKAALQDQAERASNPAASGSPRPNVLPARDEEAPRKDLCS